MIDEKDKVLPQLPRKFGTVLGFVLVAIFASGVPAW